MPHSNLKALTLVRVGEILTNSTLQRIGDGILESFHGTIEDYTLPTHPTPPHVSIDAFFMTMVLNYEYPGQTLGITDAYVVHEKEVVYGAKNDQNLALVVSTRDLCDQIIDDTDLEVFINRISKVAVHEIGHNFRLTDHCGMVESIDGYCPMSSLSKATTGRHSYPMLVIDQRGREFCDDCKEFLYQVHDFKK